MANIEWNVLRDLRICLAISKFIEVFWVENENMGSTSR